MKIQNYVRLLSLVVLLVSLLSINQPAHASTSSVGQWDMRIGDRNFAEFQDIIQDQPAVSVVVNPPSVNIGEAALAKVNLNNVPAEGYSSIELTCSYDPNMLEATSIVVASLFGIDPVTAINGPQGGHFIVAIVGSSGNKATASGTVIAFSVRGLQAGQTALNCEARVPEGNGELINIESIPTSVTVLGGPLTPTLAPAPCDKAEFIADINVPPGTVMAPSAPFIKTWRLTNVGSCTWTTAYQFVFFSGELMGAPASVSLNVNVVAGQTVDISLNMTAPAAPGRYRGYWMFKNASGALFGVGPQANEPWFVDIEVLGATPTPTIVPAPCDKAEFIADINVPPGTAMLPGTTFTKTWRFKNVGTCTWTPSYRIAFYSGEQMGAPSSAQFPLNVAPGQMVDLSLNMTAPSTVGSYRSYWIFQNEAGGLFGVGGLGNDPWFVDIVVSNTTLTPGPTDTPSPTPSVTPGGPTATPISGAAYDFAANACAATWFSGAGQLPCPGIDGNPNGFVLKMNNPKLENGTVDSRPGILTFPQNVQDGYIQGFYPPFHVQNGDRFRSTISCEFGATSCYLAFRLDYELGGTIRTFWGPFRERYDGQFYNVDVDLSALAGKDVRFILTLLSSGTATGDRALWIGPIIYRANTDPTSTSEPTTSETPGVTPSFTPTPVFTVTPFNSPTSDPQIFGVLTGQVLAGKQVNISMYDTNQQLVISVDANSDGTYSITAPAGGTYAVVATAPGHLSAQGHATITTNTTTTMPTIHLLPGDIDGNNVIDQFDVLTIGMNYSASTPAAADLNNDGIINVLDLELLAQHYRDTGPVVWQ